MKREREKRTEKEKVAVGYVNERKRGKEQENRIVKTESEERTVKKKGKTNSQYKP